MILQIKIQNLNSVIELKKMVLFLHCLIAKQLARINMDK